MRRGSPSGDFSRGEAILSYQIEPYTTKLSGGGTVRNRTEPYLLMLGGHTYPIFPLALKTNSIGRIFSSFAKITRGGV